MKKELSRMLRRHGLNTVIRIQDTLYYFTKRKIEYVDLEFATRGSEDETRVHSFYEQHYLNIYSKPTATDPNADIYVFITINAEYEINVDEESLNIVSINEDRYLDTLPHEELKDERYLEMKKYLDTLEFVDQLNSQLTIATETRKSYKL